MDQFDDLRRLLKAYDLSDGYALGRVLGCSGPTARSRIKDPSRLTLGEICSICVRGGVPADKIRDAIKFSVNGRDSRGETQTRQRAVRL